LLLLSVGLQKAINYSAPATGLIAKKSRRRQKRSRGAEI
jgi:hypothetical protein